MGQVQPIQRLIQAVAQPAPGDHLGAYPSQVWGVAYGPTSALLGACVGDGTAHCLRLA